MKFGGSLLASKGGVRRAARVIATRAKEDQVVAVVSALGDVTDLLLRAARDSKHWKESQINLFVDGLRDYHSRVLRDAGIRRAVEGSARAEALLEGLRVTLLGVSILGELTPRSMDLILSFGERLSAPIVADALKAEGLETKALTGGEAGIITDGSHGEALPIEKVARRAVKRRLNQLVSRGVVPVVTGFVAATENGDLVTLGRGGSDFTATLLGTYWEADEIWIWTDVDGIMTADPRLVPGARVVRELSYVEAEEMAVFGAKNMHPLALGPVRLSKIPVRIKNGFSPDSPGTLIWSSQKKSAEVVKSIALVRDVGMLTVSGETLAGRPGTAANIFRSLADSGVNILMISQSVSESNISVVLRRGTLDRAGKALQRGLSGLAGSARVDLEPDVAVVAAVGAGMKGTPGVAARVFSAVSRAGVNVRMIAQGSSELNVSFVVGSEDAVKAVRALHTALIANPR
ncbi:MAG: aspartate kinase [Nitrososphaerota archaeon]|jgi:aspartate kinase|nr:aspartate kinase [Nitrososphaerota archaeon]MCL5672124.1 aspartate kinase [Nitrososphaerota archaeon]MDG6911892.1 aspartate kinase [Nitrososphaerota archaeon]MDG6924445.1 aspartate kinase [Nitrososphaerota archaeon]MDG6941103.1 aspartate kinase [Nitrososphaerota archaeon]